MVLWLLDQGPADLRTSSLRTMPVPLAHVIAHILAGSLAGIRDAYRSARSDLADAASPAELEAVQSALEAQAAVIMARQREVDLVRAALRRSPARANRHHRLD